MTARNTKPRLVGGLAFHSPEYQAMLAKGRAEIQAGDEQRVREHLEVFWQPRPPSLSMRSTRPQKHEDPPLTGPRGE